ncbi:RDD family protein [Prosthecobacter sp.]|uniref:RDD family protein n=1 Tax=Prosthecobacter sp. TaxID=1965333 RepID=UPI003784FE60
MNPPEINPHAAPQSATRAGGPVKAADARPAGLGKRFLTWAIDRVGVIATFMLILKILSLLAQATNWRSGMSIPEDSGTILLTMVGFYLAAAFVYYTSFEALPGCTLGQWITGTKVVTASGAPLTFRRVLLRSLIRLVPLDALSFFTTTKDSGWHDRWAGTRVVDLRAGSEVRPRPMPTRQPAVFRPGEKREGDELRSEKSSSEL